MARLLYSTVIVLTVTFFTQSWALENPVIPEAKLGEYIHGTFPSLGKRTHVGVDLVAPCGREIYAFASGLVSDLIVQSDDDDFDELGYMVLLEHPPSFLGKPFYTIYLHMAEPPKVIPGQDVIGGQTILGLVGKTGGIDSCQTHFEVRYFSKRLSKWKQVYGKRDKRSSDYFKENWADPIILFARYPKGLTPSTQEKPLDSLPYQPPRIGLKVTWNTGGYTQVVGVEGKRVITSFVSTSKTSKQINYMSFQRAEDNVKFDKDDVDKIWPLQPGKKVEYETIVLRKMANSSEKVKMRVLMKFYIIGKEDIEFPFGQFSSFLIEVETKLIKSNASHGVDRYIRRLWYVPEYHIILKSTGIYYKKNREAKSRQSVSAIDITFIDDSSPKQQESISQVNVPSHPAPDKGV